MCRKLNFCYSILVLKNRYLFRDIYLYGETTWYFWVIKIRLFFEFYKPCTGCWFSEFCFLENSENKKNNGMQIYFCNDEKTVQYARLFEAEKKGGGLLKCWNLSNLPSGIRIVYGWLFREIAHLVPISHPICHLRK